MTIKEQIMQAIYNNLEAKMIANKFILFRNKEVDIELDSETKLVNIIDGKANVIDTVLSPRIDTIELEIPVELYIQKEEGNNIDLDLDSFEESIKNFVKSNNNLNTLIKDLSFSQSENTILEPENGEQFKVSEFNLVVVFDDV